MNDDIDSSISKSHKELGKQFIADLPSESIQSPLLIDQDESIIIIDGVHYTKTFTKNNNVMFVPSLYPEENMSSIEDVVSITNKEHRKI
jgi:hypothetical protein